MDPKHLKDLIELHCDFIEQCANPVSTKHHRQIMLDEIDKHLKSLEITAANIMTDCQALAENTAAINRLTAILTAKDDGTYDEAEAKADAVLSCYTDVTYDDAEADKDAW